MNKLIDWFADRPNWVFTTAWTVCIAAVMAGVVLLGVWAA